MSDYSDYLKKPGGEADERPATIGRTEPPPKPEKQPERTDEEWIEMGLLLIPEKLRRYVRRG